jgi:hypothetical protein|eukprot:COSAG06_NODE_5145_length_3682_cov_3.651130_2_plen_87_part_00
MSTLRPCLRSSILCFLHKTPPFSQRFLSLSRACLGTLIVFQHKSGSKKAFFAPILPPSLQLVARNLRAHKPALQSVPAVDVQGAAI